MLEVGLISNTSLTPEQFVMMICEEFEVPLGDSDSTDKARMLSRFHEFLLEQFAKKKRVILIIDEAQNLTPESLEEIRMLSNLEAEKHHLIQIILVGQPELKYKLQLKELEQFAQRITVHCHLEGLKAEELDHYIRYRLQVAGAGHADIFRPDAIEAVHRHSRGIPRLINILCDTALVFGFADSLTAIDKAVIEAVVKSRRAGGLFDPNEKQEGTTPQEHLVVQTTGLSTGIPENIRALEGRIQSLETIIAGHQKQIELLNKTKEKRDEMIVALFRMLKESLESRMKMVEPFAKLSELNDHPDTITPGTGNRLRVMSEKRPFHTMPKMIFWSLIALVTFGMVLFTFLNKPILVPFN